MCANCVRTNRKCVYVPIEEFDQFEKGVRIGETPPTKPARRPRRCAALKPGGVEKKPYTRPNPSQPSRLVEDSSSPYTASDSLPPSSDGSLSYIPEPTSPGYLVSGWKPSTSTVKPKLYHEAPPSPIAPINTDSSYFPPYPTYEYLPTPIQCADPIQQNPSLCSDPSSTYCPISSDFSSATPRSKRDYSSPFEASSVMSEHSPLDSSYYYDPLANDPMQAVYAQAFMYLSKEEWTPFQSNEGVVEPSYHRPPAPTPASVLQTAYENHSQRASDPLEYFEPQPTYETGAFITSPDGYDEPASFGVSYGFNPFNRSPPSLPWRGNGDDPVDGHLDAGQPVLRSRPRELSLCPLL